jgi:lycopene beta-cyclase
MTIEEIIEYIKIHKERLGITLYPPATEAEVLHFEKELNLKLPDEIRDFYLFCNGFESDEDLFRIIPLSEILTNKDDYKSGNFYIAEYLMYSDTWNVEIKTENTYEIVNYNSEFILLTNKFSDFLEIFLQGGVFEIGGIYDCQQKITLKDHYDYIIAGGGMAGLSLAFYMNESEILRGKKILIIDKEPKLQNDRTWCFWERGENNPFEKIIFYKWKQADFFSDGFSERFELKTYFYKMLRGIDFYEYIMQRLRQNPNIVFEYDTIQEITNRKSGAVVKTERKEYTADYVFDSVFKPDFKAGDAHFILQHFKGWVITVPEPVFEPESITLHDFRIEQFGDEARFFYLLPFSKNQALLEYTLFSPSLLLQDEYDAHLKEYLQQTLKIDAYQINETEFGIIPMSDALVLSSNGSHVIRIGTAGGYVRPSTGYTFARTQRFLQNIVKKLELGQSPDYQPSKFKKRFALYDSIMLNVLTKKRYAGAKFFSRLYKKNNIETIFDFLDEKSTLFQELRLMSTTPLHAFVRAAFEEIRKRIFR